MDPLRGIIGDLHDLIFQHLNTNEILEYSTISKRWYEKIGNSRRCMKKIRLALKFWRSTAKEQQIEEKLKILKSISRRYQNISIDCRFDKRVSAEFWNLLSVLADNIVSLKIKSINVTIDSSKPLFQLNKLEELKLVYVPVNIRNIMLSSCNPVKLKLKLVSPLNWSKTSKTDTESLSCIRHFMTTNERLKDVEIYGAIQYRFFFDEDFSKLIKFRLNTLKIKNDLRLSLIPEECERNLIDFLATQSESLEKIFIDVCRPAVIHQVFNNMKNLATIHIETVVMTDFKVRDLNLKLNENVVDLRIPYITNNQDIKEILQYTPNLTSLFVAHLSIETMEFVAWNLKKLTLLKYRYDEIDCENLYDRLKEQNVDVNQNIEMVVDYEYT